MQSAATVTWNCSQSRQMKMTTTTGFRVGTLLGQEIRRQEVARNRRPIDDGMAPAIRRGQGALTGLLGSLCLKDSPAISIKREGIKGKV